MTVIYKFVYLKIEWRRLKEKSWSILVGLERERERDRYLNSPWKSTRNQFYFLPKKDVGKK